MMARLLRGVLAGAFLLLSGAMVCAEGPLRVGLLGMDNYQGIALRSCSMIRR